MEYQTSAGIIVYRKKDSVIEYLLLKYAAGHWDFAKGHVEPGETKQETALRELQEEAGISANITPDFKTSFEYMFKNRERELVKKRVYFFVGEAIGESVTLSNEHLDYCWLPYEEAKERLTYVNAKQVLSEANNFVLDVS